MIARSLPHPRETLAVFGHEAPESQFLTAKAAGRLHHAWLVHGPEGIGKATLCFRLARHLLGAMDGPAARRVSAGTHADLVHITRAFDERRNRYRGEIVVDDIRPLQAFLHHTAAEGGWRVVIIDGAEEMNRSASNALLKILEEPPEKTVIFLVTSAPARLLPTIRSRCRTLALLPLHDNDVRQAIDVAAFGATEIESVLSLAQGAPGRALRTDAEYRARLAHLVEDWTRGNAATPDACEVVLRNEDGFAQLCDLLEETLVARAREHARCGDAGTAGRIAGAYAALGTLRRETQRFNLDKAQATLQAAAIVSEL